MFASIEIWRSFEFAAADLEAAHPGQREGPQRIALQILGDQIPAAIDLAKMERMDSPEFGGVRS